MRDFMLRAGRNPQVWPCLGFGNADFWPMNQLNKKGIFSSSSVHATGSFNVLFLVLELGVLYSCVSYLLVLFI